MIDQLDAMRRTLEVARMEGQEMMSSDVPETDFAHLQEMYEKAKFFDDEAKIGRFLGWIQACVVTNSMGELTLDDMRQINKGCER